ncbi:MAG: UbiA prenyltransferase family protein [Bacteroidia bacterium]
MLPILRLIRPHHWIKNVLIFAPLVLSFGFVDVDKIGLSLLGFLSWSLLASAGYIYNDLQDVAADRAHPIKMNRPLAAGLISKQTAILLAVILLMAGLTVAYFIGIKALYMALLYVGVNALYSTWLKHIRWVDIVVLSSFYLMRIFMGGLIIDVKLTHWFVATCSFAFLAMATNKRVLSAKITAKSPIADAVYTQSDQAFLHLISIVFAVATIVFLNLHLIQLLGNQNRPYEMVIVNLISTLLLLFYFDDKKTDHDDPVRKITSHLPTLILVTMLVGYYVYLLN